MFLVFYTGSTATGTTIQIHHFRELWSHQRRIQFLANAISQVCIDKAKRTKNSLSQLLLLLLLFCYFYIYLNIFVIRFYSVFTFYTIICFFLLFFIINFPIAVCFSYIIVYYLFSAEITKKKFGKNKYYLFKLKCSVFSSLFISDDNEFFSIKMDMEKLVQEKTEMQRHYVMVSAEYFHFYFRR